MAQTAVSAKQGLELLETTPLGSLFPDHPSDTLISFSKSDTLSHVFKGLVEHKILSAPVFDPIHHTYNAFVDMVDIVAYFVSNFSEKELSDLGSVQQLLSTERCGKASDCSGRDPFRPVEAMASLLTAITKMVRSGVHRIPVINSEGDLVTIVTQSHVVKYVYQYTSKFGNLGHTPIESLDMIHKPVVTVGLADKALEAFKSMHENRISAVAVVDESGRLVGNISVSDLKLIGYDGSLFTRLHYSVAQFMKLLAQDRGNKVEAPVCVTAGATFSDVVSKLVNSRIHRVYLVDSTFAPLGVLTQKEVLKALLEFLHVEYM